MAKELDRLGLPVALITCLVDVGALIGVNRIVTAPAIVHPLGQPSLSLEGERAFRRQVVERALEALRTDVTGRRCFGPTVPDGPCVAWRSTVKLTVQIFDVQSVEFGPRTLLEGHHLVVSREELLDRVGRDPAFAAMDVRLIRPGERKRILNVLGITEPRAKL